MHFASNIEMDKLAVITFLVVLGVVSVFSQFLGETQITIKQIEKCGEDDPGLKMEYKIHKINRTHQGIDFVLDSSYDFDKTIALNTTAAKWGDGGWKPHAFDMYDPSACDLVMKYGKKDLEYLLTKVGREPNCPITKGRFEVKDFVFDGKIGAPTMYGEFRIDVNLEKDGKSLSCVRAFIKCDPPKVPKFG